MRERYEIMKAMHLLIRAMNDEGAYCSWIYTVPDGATDDDLWDIARTTIFSPRPAPLSNPP